MPLAQPQEKPASAPSGPRSAVIVNAQVADGTGGPLKSANVRINGDRIVKVGQFTPRQDEYVIDAKGLVLAPGFIDIHSPRPAAFGGDRQRHGQPRIADSASGCHAQLHQLSGVSR
jgi:imidazolonepropionase-like amidohydrolase